MAQYKVPQNVEAEDKIIGPLTMKQFIYAVMGVMYGFLSFQLFKGAPVVFILVGVPPTFLLLMLGLYQRQDQPFEALFLALVNFNVKPRRRVWHKEPLAEAFKIEAPKVTVEAARRDPRQVRGQLEKLAAIVDTRGLAAKRPEIQEPGLHAALDLGDRLGAPQLHASLQADGAPVELVEDILDFKKNPNSQNLEALLAGAAGSVRQAAVDKMKQPVRPSPASPSAPSHPNQSASGMTVNPIAGILKAAMQNDALTVSQLASQAQRTQATENRQ
ncbi:PrgI family protein [Candidatus Parcubacteria bacterium]|nr:PrgI family protein [Candidatus Parcubacteria bacterium]